MSTRTVSFFFRLFSAVVFLSIVVGAPGGISNVFAGTDSWTTSGPGGGRILALAIDPETPATVYAGTWGSGVYKSTDGGGTWNPAGSGLTDAYINTLVIDPKNVTSLYVGTYHGIYKSTDGGLSWQEANTGITDYQIQTLAIDLQTPSTVYAGAFGCVFKSLDAGGHWSAKTTGLSNISIWVMAVDPLDPDTLYAGTGFEGIYKSIDSGEHWYPVNTGLTDTNIYSLAIDPATPGTLYVGTEHGGIFKSTDGGENWNNIFTRLPESYISVRSLAIDPLTPSILYAGTDNGVFRSTNGGEQWMPANVGLSLNSQVTALAVDPSTPATVYTGTWNDGGVYRSTDSGMLWTLANSGLANTMVYTLAIDPLEPAILYAGTYEFGVFKSNDAGESWFPVNTGLTNQDVGILAIDPLTPSTLYAGTYDSLFKSSDGGENWFPINNGLTVTDVDALAIDPVTPSTLYAGTYGGGVFKSADGGMHWRAVNHGLSALYTAALSIDPVTPSTLYAGTYEGGVFKSTNGGEDWIPVNNGLTFFDVKSLAIDPVTPSTLYAGTYGGGVFKSTNRGVDWFPASDGLTMRDMMDLAIDPDLPATLYAATYGGVFKSTNGGLHWIAMNTGVTNSRINALAIDPVHPTTHYAGTDGAGAAKYSSSLLPCRAAWGQVVINEIFPSPSNNGTEWVELYNTSAQPVNLGYCFIDDTPAAGSPPVQIPADTIIPAHGFWTLDQVSYFNNAGDDVRFLKEDRTTLLDSYTYSMTGYDLSRYRLPNGGPWQSHPTTSPTKGQSNLYFYPVVSSIVRTGTGASGSASVAFKVTFSAAVTGINTSTPFGDFSLTTTGVTGAAIIAASGSGSTYTVTVNTGSGNGTIRLNVLDDDSIQDAGNNPLGGIGAGNGSFVTGETYTITQGASVIVGINFIGNYPVMAAPSTHVSQPGIMGGPVEVLSTRGARIFTSERVISGASFNEIMGYPTDQLTTEYWFPWYDNLSMSTWVLVRNPSTTSSAAVDIYIGGVKRGSYTIAKGKSITPRFALQTGPVQVVSSNRVPIFTSERSLYGTNNSFNEVMGYPANQFTTEYWFPFYDNVGMTTWILVGNPSTTSTAAVDIYIGGVKKGTYAIPKGGQITSRFNLPAGAGPVRVVSTNGVKIFSSERTVYGDSFNEVMGYPASQLTTEYWFLWYDNVGMSTWVLVGNPTGSTANVDIFVGGVKQASYSIGAGKQINQRYNFNTGPVRVVSTNGVKIFSSERVLYGTSFNEVMGYPGNKLTTEYWFPWYDSTSMSTDILVGRP